MIKKREIEKFPYGTGPGLSETEATKNFVIFCKKYGPLTLRIGLFAIIMSSSAFAADGPSPGPVVPSSAPNAPKVLPATKELLGIAAVGLICAAAASNPVTAMGIAACVVTIAAKAANKL